MMEKPYKRLVDGTSYNSVKEMIAFLYEIKSTPDHPDYQKACQIIDELFEKIGLNLTGRAKKEGKVKIVKEKVVFS